MSGGLDETGEPARRPLLDFRREGLGGSFAKYAEVIVVIQGWIDLLPAAARHRRQKDDDHYPTVVLYRWGTSAKPCALSPVPVIGKRKLSPTVKSWDCNQLLKENLA